MMMKTTLEQHIAATLQHMGLDLWACDYLPQGRHSLLRIYIDKPGGVSMEDCQLASQQLSALLDVEDPFSGRYTLEVSSPGIPRPLLKSAHYALYVGHKADVTLFQPIGGRRKWQGSIEKQEKDVLVLQVGSEQVELLFSNIAKAYLIE